jgi:hypothetical protein
VVRGRLEGVRSVSEVAELYEQASNTGNREHLRAFAELGAGLVNKHFSGEPGAGSLAKRMETDARNLLDTEGMKAVRDKGNLLVHQAVELVEHTEEIHQFFKVLGEVYAYSDWQDIYQGVHLSSSLNPENLGMTHHLELVNEPVETQVQLFR